MGQFHKKAAVSGQAGHGRSRCRVGGWGFGTVWQAASHLHERGPREVPERILVKGPVDADAFRVHAAPGAVAALGLRGGPSGEEVRGCCHARQASRRQSASRQVLWSVL